MIHEEAPNADILKEKESILLQSKIVDCDWLFNIAEVYYDNKNYERAVEFLNYGIKRVEKSDILPRYYNLLAICYHYKKNYEDANNVYQLAIEGTDNDRSKQIYLGNIGQCYFSLALQLKDAKKNFEKELIDAIDWLTQAIELEKTHSIKPSARNLNNRGRCYVELCDIEKSREKKALLLKHSIEDYSQAIMIQPENYVYYWNRFRGYERLGQVKECIEDLIQAEYIRHDDKYIDNLSRLFEKQPGLIAESAEFYKKLAGQNEGPHNW